MKCNEATQGYCANADQDGNCYNVECEAHPLARSAQYLNDTGIMRDELSDERTAPMTDRPADPGCYKVSGQD